MNNIIVKLKSDIGLTEDDMKTVEEIILDKYHDIFDSTKGIPSITEMYQSIDYDFDTKAYDVIYGISKYDLREENIMCLLSKQGCVFKWGGTICCDAQIMMFEELLDGENADLIMHDLQVIGIHQ